MLYILSSDLDSFPHAFAKPIERIPLQLADLIVALNDDNISLFSGLFVISRVPVPIEQPVFKTPCFVA